MFHFNVESKLYLFIVVSHVSTVNCEKKGYLKQTREMERAASIKGNYIHVDIVREDESIMRGPASLLVIRTP